MYVLNEGLSKTGGVRAARSDMQEAPDYQPPEGLKSRLDVSSEVERGRTLKHNERSLAPHTSASCAVPYKPSLTSGIKLQR
jgi:hypothetical protein